MNEGVAGLTMPSQLMERGDSNENGVLSSPSSPEFLLPAFESNLQLSSSPILDQTEACADDAELQRSERPTVGRLRRFSRGQTIKKAARSPNRGALQHDSQALLDTADVRKFKKAGKQRFWLLRYMIPSRILTLICTPQFQNKGLHSPYTTCRRSAPPRAPVGQPLRPSLRKM